MMRIARMVAAVTMAASGGVVAVAGPAAAVDADCKTVVTELKDRPDNGHGTGGSPQPGYWADLTFTRTVTICRVHGNDKAVAGVDAEVKVPGPVWSYHADVDDKGTLVTRGGPTLSPNNGVALTAGVEGTVKGHFEVDFVAPADWKGFDKTRLHGKTIVGDPKASPADGNPTTTEWVPYLWTAGYVGKGGPSGFDDKSWWWKYKTCAEFWWDAADKASGDGTTDAAGDITGAKPCPRPSESVSVSPSPSVTVTVTPTMTPPGGDEVGLPVTGDSVPVGLIAGGGAGAVLVGAGLLVLLRRRRRAVFEA